MKVLLVNGSSHEYGCKERAFAGISAKLIRGCVKQMKMKVIVKSTMLGIMISSSLLGSLSASAAQIEAGEAVSITQELQSGGSAVLPFGVTNDGYAKYFTGTSYLSNLSTDKNLPVYNVTFAHGAHTFWHIHNGSCQVLVGASGRGYYQVWGEKAHEMKPGESATIPAGVKHWHGAAPGTSFQHIAMFEQKSGITTTWLEPVDEAEYQALK